MICTLIGKCANWRARQRRRKFRQDQGDLTMKIMAGGITGWLHEGVGLVRGDAP
jgi:hypothetical protein